jgi:hypothetical protein
MLLMIWVAHEIYYTIEVHEKNKRRDSHQQRILDPKSSRKYMVRISCLSPTTSYYLGSSGGALLREMLVAVRNIIFFQSHMHRWFRIIPRPILGAILRPL